MIRVVVFLFCFLFAACASIPPLPQATVRLPETHWEEDRIASIGDSGGFSSSQTNNNGGGGLPNASSLDPTLSIGSGLMGLNVTPEQKGALGDVIRYFAGAMTSGSSTLTDSTNSPFTSADVDKLICVNGASATTVTDAQGTRHVELCGTISAFTNSSTVTLSFTNASGGSISSVQYKYGTNDSTAVQAAETAACNAGGGTVWLYHEYAMNVTLTGCTTYSVNFAGFGQTRPNLGSPNHLGSGLWWGTKSLSGHGLALTSVAGTTTVAATTVSNLAITAGVGINYDGGSTTSAGVAILNRNNTRLTNVSIDGWGQAGVYTDVLANSANDYIAGITLDNTLVSHNFIGFQVGSVATVSDAGFFQDIHLTSYSQFVNNFEWGLVQYHQTWALHVDGGSLFQGNDETNSTSYQDFDQTAGCYGCMIEGTYWEMDQSNENGFVEKPASSNAVLIGLHHNVFVCDSSNQQAMTLGVDFTHQAEDSSVIGNIGGGCANNKFLVNTAVMQTVEEDNVNANQVTWDLMDQYGPENTLYLAVSANTGALSIAQTTVGGLPSTCTAGQLYVVTDATSLTPGTCTGSGGDTTLAICQGSNTWNCL